MGNTMTAGSLKVSKKILTGRQMSDAAYIDQAVQWSRDLTRMRTRGPGDIENAMRAIEREYGVDYWTLWQLRYARSRVRTMGVSIYVRLRDAYEAECARQVRKLRHEIEITQKISGPADPLVVAAQALVEEKE